jgi:hypothetical protein
MMRSISPGMRNRFILLEFLALIFILGCQSDGSGKENKEAVIQSKKLDSINVISLKDDYSKGLIRLYNQDASLWKSFKMDDNFSDDQINPMAMEGESNILVFRVVGRSDNFYSVIVNEDNGLIKLIEPNNKFFAYETWQDHIVNAFSVEFLPKTNPLRENPSENSRTLLFEEEQFYHPMEIKGDWLRVRDEQDKEGWIKWRNEKGELLVEIFYEE